MTVTSETTRTAAAANIVDVWMGGNTEWRHRLEESEFLESADWAMALILTDAVLRALPASCDTHPKGHDREAGRGS